MKIDLHKIPVREVITGYKDSAEEGVVAYGGNLLAYGDDATGSDNISESLCIRKSNAMP